MIYQFIYIGEDKMRKLQRIILFIVISMMINICLFGLFTINGYTYIYNVGLKLNTRIVDVNDDEYNEYLFFKKQLNKNMVYLIKDKPDSELIVAFYIDYIKYLNKETGIKYILDEIGFSAGQIINLYLQTGDESFLNQVFESADDLDTYSLYRKSYYKKLYEYNITLPETDRINLYGIDTETHERSHSILYMDYLIKKIQNKSIPMKINSILNGIRYDTDVYFNNVKKSLEQNNALYKELFVEDYFNFSMLVDNYFTDRSDYNTRLQKMAVNFIKIYDKNIRGKYFGVFSDTNFIEKMLTIYNGTNNRITVLEIQNTLLFNDADKTGKIFTVNNKYLKYFIKYREFVYKINGQELSDSFYRDSDTFFALNDNTEEY